MDFVPDRTNGIGNGALPPSLQLFESGDDRQWHLPSLPRSFVRSFVRFRREWRFSNGVRCDERDGGGGGGRGREFIRKPLERD